MMMPPVSLASAVRPAFYCYFTAFLGAKSQPALLPTAVAGRYLWDFPTLKSL